ncbi:MAG: hypothetical protein R2939_04575 [Kofleriaceae bacterium]
MKHVPWHLLISLSLVACGPVAAKELRSTTQVNVSVADNDDFLRELATVIERDLGAQPTLQVGGDAHTCTGATVLQDTLTWACDDDRTLQIVYAILDDQLTAHIFTPTEAQGRDLKTRSDAWVQAAVERWSVVHP